MPPEAIIGGTPTPTPTEGTPTTGTPPADTIRYPDSFPEEFHGNPNVMKFYNKESKDFDYGNMMTSLIHAQKMVGGDKILVPNKDSSQDDWKNVFQKLGLPEREAYKLGIEGVDEVADDMTKGFIDKAHELGVLPQQARGIVEYFNESQKNQEAQSIQDSKDAATQALENLKQEWKGSYDDNISLVNETLDKLFTDEEKQAANEAGYFSDPVFVKMMHSIAPKLMDDTTLSGHAPRVGGFEGEQSIRDEYETVTRKMMLPEHKNSPALQRRLELVLEQATKKGIQVYG